MRSATLSAQLRLGPTGLQSKLRGEISEKQPRWFTDAIADQVYAQRGAVKSIASELGIPDKEHRIYAIADRNKPAICPAFYLPAICQATGTFTVLDVLEAQVGRRAFVLPSASLEGGEFFEQSTECFATLSKAVQQLPGILEDGHISDEERARFVAKASEGQAALARLVDMVDTKAAADAQQLLQAAAR
jgi:hypothetical protein